MTELNTTMQDIAYVGLDMSMLPMFTLHTIQQTTIKEIKAWEHVVCDQLMQLKNIVSLLQSQL